MKIEIKLTDDWVRDLLGGAYIAYWAKVLSWNRKTLRIKLKVEDGTVAVITKKDIVAGLGKMAQDKDAARHLASIVSDSTDAYTGDAVIQMAAFGELKYG